MPPKSMDKSKHDKPLVAKEEKAHGHMHQEENAHETHKLASKKGHRKEHEHDEHDAAHQGERHSKNDVQPKLHAQDEQK